DPSGAERKERSSVLPAQDLMVWILRSSTTTLRRWVMSPASRNTFISDPSLPPPPLLCREREGPLCLSLARRARGSSAAGLCSFPSSLVGRGGRGDGARRRDP